MKDEIKFRDLLQFLLDNIKIILTSIVVVTLIAVSYVIYDQITLDETDRSTSSIERANMISEERFEEMAEWPLELYTEPQIRQMQAYLLPHAYKLSIYAEHENFEPIANTTFMREVFRNQEVLDFVEEELGEELTPSIEFAIHIENIANSGIYELHFQRGSLEESLELGLVVMDAIEEGIIPVLDTKTVSFIDQEPEVLVTDYSDYYDELDAGDISLRRLAREGVVFGLLGTGVGLILGLLIALINLIFNKHISSLYDYAREESDRIVKLNHLHRKSEAQMIVDGMKNINTPTDQMKILLYDESTESSFENLFEKLTPNVLKFTDINQWPDNTKDISEVIILAKLNKTNKSWYDDQRVQLKGYNLPIKIIQL